MKTLDLDPRFTFDNFVVGAPNRLAAAAARRVADAPGAAYNPLFLYSGSGLGKTHLAMAIGQHARRVHGNLIVVYETLEHLLEGVMNAIQAGERDAFRTRLRHADLLLLDDVQFLAGRRGAQEELLRAWDALTARGGQVVLASDRPPTEIDGLDQRLLTRFSGGLIADIGIPEFETRIVIARRKADERGQTLAPGVAETLARVEFTNVRELQGALNRVLAVQELEDRTVTAEEVARLLGVGVEARSADEFGAFLTDIAGTVGEVVSSVTPEERLADAILRWEGEGFRTRRLELALDAPPPEAETQALIDEFADDVERLGDVGRRIRELDAEARELERLEVLRNPDRVDDAEALLAAVEARTRSLPQPPSSPNFDELALDRALLAVRAARAVAEAPGERYNPLFVHGPEGSGKTALLIALANGVRARAADVPLAFLTGAEFGAELMDAIQSNHVDGWRARYRRARVLLLDDVHALAGTERVQEELFHLFDDVVRAGGQLVFAADSAPRLLQGLEDRLRTRL
ncbi:MAG: DnaA ATPase domain-containing protein, partial [Longimicrobiales bacterium]